MATSSSSFSYSPRRKMRGDIPTVSVDPPSSPVSGSDGDEEEEKDRVVPLTHAREDDHANNNFIPGDGGTGTGGGNLLGNLNLDLGSPGPPPVSSVLRCRRPPRRRASNKMAPPDSDGSRSSSPPLEQLRKMSDQSFRNFLDCFRRHKNTDANELQMQMQVRALRSS